MKNINKTIRKILFLITTILGNIFGINSNFTVFVCYHSFTKNSNYYAIDIFDFRKQIEKLNKHGKFISVEDAIQKTNTGQNYVLTIDDGYKDVLKIVPIVKKYKIPVLLFVLSNPNKANRKELDSQIELLNTKDIKFLQKEGWTIGSHSATHANLVEISSKELNKEVVDSKKTLEKTFKTTIKYFAYPKGEYNNKVINSVKKAKYKAGFSCNVGTIVKNTNVYSIPRTVVNSSYSHVDFPFLLLPSSQILKLVIGKTNIWNLIKTRI